MSQRSNYLLFAIPALIWGSTWYVIKFQLDTVEPLMSVSYRFFAGGWILILFCLLAKKPLKFSLEQHLRLMLQGILLFGMNYWLVYMAEEYIASGLVAVGFSTLIFFNIFFGALFMGNSIKKRVLIGAAFGLIGTSIIFWPELRAFSSENGGFLGLTLMITSVITASLGNITSAYNSRLRIPVIQATAIGMLYGSLVMFAIAMILGKPITIDTSTEYIGSLIYLTIFGSILAFSAYLTLISRIGPDKAAYAIVVVPVVAILISTALEGYRPTLYTFLGMSLLIAGNVFALYKKKVAQPSN